MKPAYPNSERVTTAVLLAAGTGTRLYPLTNNAPKCLTLVHGISILERLISGLHLHGFKRLVVVTGYLEDRIRKFLGDRVGSMKIEYVFNPSYETTNNIYSLWMARKVISEPFLLVESDIVFDESLLRPMLYPNRMAVATMQPWMKGTSVTIDQHQRVQQFHVGNAASFVEPNYKTVNVYSISLASWRRIVERLDVRISGGEVGDYYEVVFAELVDQRSLSFETVCFDGDPWFEIDTLEDLKEAEKQFPPDSYATSKTVPLPHSDRRNMRLLCAGQKPSKPTEVFNVAE
jgi:choline kinase